jgi:toxin-antitoxin system PIN domain toxin
MRGILVDTSVWVAAFFEEHEFFPQANRFISLRTAKEPALFCRASEQSWLRLLTTPSLHKLYKTPNTTNRHAVAILSNWRAQTHVDCLDSEPSGTRELWLELASIASASPKVWMDAYLAAFAIRAGLPFATLDADFRRFETAGLELRLLTV